MSEKNNVTTSRAIMMPSPIWGVFGLLIIFFIIAGLFCLHLIGFLVWSAYLLVWLARIVFWIRYCIRRGALAWVKTTAYVFFLTILVGLLVIYPIGYLREALILTAIEDSQYWAVKCLLWGSLDTRPNSQLHTALNLAINHANADIAEKLLQNGADPNGNTGRSGYGPSGDQEGVPFLYLAAIQRGPQKIIIDLIMHGANVNAKTSSGDLALNVAVWRYGKDVIDLFLAKGADINATSKDGTTALISAVTAKKNTEAVKALLSHDLDLEIKDNEGKTARMHALELGNWNAVDLIDEYLRKRFSSNP